MKRSMIRYPVVTIVGTTGVGKSDLSIRLAQKYPAEIINADALQIYSHLDIATNKLPMDERSGIPHHLLGIKPWHAEYTVLDFVKDASKKINDIRSRGKMPILVGGTNYYIQSLIWSESLVSNVEKSVVDYSSPNSFYQVDSSVDKEIAGRIIHVLSKKSSDLTENELHELLKEIDPLMAERWHHRDVRKIKRSLSVFLESGKRHSELLMSQKKQNAEHISELGSDEVPRPQWPSIIFWLYSPLESLNPFLIQRVDKMVELGLEKEMEELYQWAGSDADCERGLLQAIGFKEFKEYFRLKHRTEDKNHDEMAELWDHGVDRMKITTRQYAKRQIAWIRRKMVPQCRWTETPIYLLDCSDRSKWYSKAFELSYRLLDNYLAQYSAKPETEFVKLDSLPDPLQTSKLAEEVLSKLPRRPSNLFKSGIIQEK